MGGGSCLSVAPEDRALLNKIPRLLHLRQPKRHLDGAPTPELVDETTSQIGNPVNAITSYCGLSRRSGSTRNAASAGQPVELPAADIALGITLKLSKALVFDEERRSERHSHHRHPNSDHYYVDNRHRCC